MCDMRDVDYTVDIYIIHTALLAFINFNPSKNK